jgi:hypothetical protein
LEKAIFGKSNPTSGIEPWLVLEARPCWNPCGFHAVMPCGNRCCNPR